MELAGHTVKAYDQKLTELEDLILEMGSRLRVLVLAVKHAVRARTREAVDAAKAEDKELNRLELELERAATVILALQNPLAVDLRFVTSALKISGVLERAGDLAKNTIKRTTGLGNYSSPALLDKLDKMSDLTVAMLDDALVAVKQRDAAKAIAVWKRDDEVDELYHAIFQDMQAEMRKNPGAVEAGTHVVFMAKNIERIADYVTNLAKTVYYIVTGEQADKSLIRSEKKPV
jgi:phosphate transport system protein